MVYRAERLYSALSDAQKIFKYISQHLFDTDNFDKIVTERLVDPLSEEDIRFVKKREQILKRLLS